MNSDTSKILVGIRKQGKKITKTRKAIIEMLCSSHILLTAPEIQERLKTLEISVNKTSVYRELEFLLSQKLIQEVHIKPRVTHYESALHPHHHHLVCTGCGDTKDIETNEFEKTMQQVEYKAAQQGFAVKEHSLEFFGTCASCLK
jgi:Fe2+ or Zn2+ uptake regulation protein